MKNTIIYLFLAIAVAFMAISCEALKKAVCPDDSGTHINIKDSVNYHFDTTRTFVSQEFRDTIPIFKGTKIFVGNNVDSLSSKDSMRYFMFEIYNYGDIAYAPNDSDFINIHFDLEINKLILFSDTIKLGSIEPSGARNFKFHFPVAWFKDKLNAKELDYHYRISLISNTGRMIDAWFPRPLNPKLPEKRFDEVNQDSIIYWARPVVVDTPIIVKRPVYAFKDTLIFIDDIIGCRVMSHIILGNNKVYTFIADTCTKRLYDGLNITDNKTTGLSALIIKASANAINPPYLSVFINDVLFDSVSVNKPDSMIILALPESFTSIKSITFASYGNVTIHSAYLNKLKLTGLANEITGNVDVSESEIVMHEKSASGILANWQFNNSGADLTGIYPLNITEPTKMFLTNTPAEGTGYLTSNGSGYFASPGIVPLTNKFSIAFWLRTWNDGSQNRPIFANSRLFYPDGYIMYMDEGVRLFKFVTGDGNGETRKFLNSKTGVFEYGEWVHVVIIGDKASGTGAIYINGKNQTGGSASVFNFRDDQPLYIGRSMDAQQCWCNLDDFRLYNKILTDAEILSIFNKENSPAGLVKNSIKFILP